MNKYNLTVCVSLFVTVVDQITKMLVRSNLPLFKRIPLLPFLDITHLRNPGAAFGMLNNLSENVRMPLFVLILAVAFIAILFFIKKAEDNDTLLISSLSLILGGAIGNSLDRFRLGYVTDFIDFYWFGNPQYNWPPFNVADAAITIGVVLILFETFFLKKVK
jgi:signal peptidase II